jgi:hypothetical protein
MKICKNCRKEIIKNPHESYKQFNKRVTCSVKCQSSLKKGIPLTKECKERLSQKLKSLYASGKKKITIPNNKGRKQTVEHIKNAIEARGYKYTPKEKRAEYRYFYGLKRKHGMTKEDYNKRLKDQKGVCAICGNGNKQKRRLCVDHCHKTGKIRGLLCVDCSVALGNVNDDIKILNKMIKYLKKYE